MWVFPAIFGSKSHMHNSSWSILASWFPSLAQQHFVLNDQVGKTEKKVLTLSCNTCIFVSKLPQNVCNTICKTGQLSHSQKWLEKLSGGTSRGCGSISVSTFHIPLQLNTFIAGFSDFLQKYLVSFALTLEFISERKYKRAKERIFSQFFLMLLLNNI